MAELGERVAVLEAKVDLIEDTLRRQTDALEALAKAQQQLLVELAKYRGGWGALLMVGSAVVTALGLAKDWLFK